MSWRLCWGIWTHTDRTSTVSNATLHLKTDHFNKIECFLKFTNSTASSHQSQPRGGWGTSGQSYCHASNLIWRSKIQTAVVRLTLTHHELKPKPASITKCEQQLFTDTSGSAAGRTHLHSYKSTAVSLHREKGGGGLILGWKRISCLTVNS